MCGKSRDSLMQGLHAFVDFLEDRCKDGFAVDIELTEEREAFTSTEPPS